MADRDFPTRPDKPTPKGTGKPDDEPGLPPRSSGGQTHAAAAGRNPEGTRCGARWSHRRVAKAGEPITCRSCRNALSLDRRHAWNGDRKRTACGARPVLGMLTDLHGGAVTCAKCLRATTPKAME